MRRFVVGLSLLAVWGAAAAAEEQPEDRIQRLEGENHALQQRVTALEAALREMQQLLRQGQAPAAPAAPPAAEKPALHTRWQTDLYGYLKLDTAFDTSSTNSGNFAAWVGSEAVDAEDSQLSVTARQSRFGLKFRGPDVAGARSSGRVEIDFYGGGTENKNMPMMRQAFLQLDWPRQDLSLLAGQTADVVSPLCTHTLNYTAGWFAGNYGYRRPQLRVTKGFHLRDGVRGEIQAAFARTVGRNNALTPPGESGMDAGFPTLQGRVGATFPMPQNHQGSVGLSGHWGKEEYDLTVAGAHQDFATWSAGLDFTLPFADWLTLFGEVWTGANLDSYLGGIGQGVNTTIGHTIWATGGWAEALLGPFHRWTFDLGAGLDDPDDAKLGAGMRARNTVFWGNSVYQLNDAVSAGLELSYWKTDYLGAGADGDSFRVHGAITYGF